MSPRGLFHTRNESHHADVGASVSMTPHHRGIRTPRQAQRMMDSLSPLAYARAVSSKVTMTVLMHLLILGGSVSQSDPRVAWY